MNRKDKKKLLEFILTITLVLGFFLYEEVIKNNLTTSTNSPKQEEIAPVNLTDNSNLKIYFIDVGQADSILIENNKEYTLIDAGNNEDGEKLVNYLHSLGVNNLKYAIGTHAHEDHIGGMDDVIKNFQVEHFFMPDAITTTKTFEDLLDALESKNISFETPEIDETFTLAESKFTVLYIGEDEKDLNDSSIVLKMTYGNTSYLFMGDATSSIEREILDKDITATVLKVGHHGSQYSTTTPFLKKVNPKYAIISVGKNNSYNHPRKSTINKLEKLGTKIYRTDIDRTIILNSNGKEINFETIKTDTNR